jgi:hypothetical protein
MGVAKRKTMRERMGSPPREPVVLKFFSGHDFFDLLMKLASKGSLDEDEQEQVIAVQTVMQRATSDNPPCCLLCHAVTVVPALIGFARRASKTGGGAVLVVCRTCLTSVGSSADLHDEIFNALGVAELKTSNWAS